MVNPLLKEKISKKLDEMAEEILAYDHKDALSISYLGGLSGILPFLFDYGHYKTDERFTDKAETYLYDMVAHMETNQVSPMFSNGIAGFGWVLEWLSEQEYLESLDLLHPFDSALSKFMLQNVNENNWDALHGAIGIAFYLFKRMENPEVKKALEEMVDVLEKKSVKDPNGLKWSNLDFKTKETVFNFGLAHGMPSIMIFFGKCLELNLRKDKASELLKDLTAYFLKQKNQDAECLYNYKNAENGVDTGPRLAWCYGDLGITVAFEYVNRIAGGLDNEIEALINDLIKRKDLKASRVNDAGFCHGASSIAFIYLYLKSKGHAQIKTEDIEYWLEHTLAMAVHEDGYGGYKAFMPREEKTDNWENDIGLLTGTVGIASVLLSVLNGNLQWSEGLMLF